jgi:hypothetical protein
MIASGSLKKFSVIVAVCGIVMASMDAVIGCMNVLTTDYNNKKQ